MAIKYTSFVADPNIVTGQQLQDYGITTLPEYQATGGSPYLLGQVDEGIQYQTPSYDKYSDLYQYYLGDGFDAEQPDFVTPPADTTPVDTTPVDTTPVDTNRVTAASAVQPTGGGVSDIIPTTTTPFVETSPNVLAATNVPGTPIVPTRDGAQVIVATRTGDTYAPGDYSDVAGTLADPREKMDYTEQQDPSWWEARRNDFIETGQDVGNFFNDLKNRGIDVGKIAISSLMNMVQPGLGFLTNILPKDTQIDKFNREYALGGDLYQNVVSQTDDPNFEGRIQGYADSLIAGTGEGKDPFGINTVSAFGDYPEYATETYNELIEKQKQRATEGKELSQFDEDRLEYYGHVSGLTGKTNIPGTPLMVDDLPFKTTPDAADTVTTIPVKEEVLKTREEQEMLDELTVEEIADIADRQPEIIEIKKNELADIYDRKVERGEEPDDPTITDDINKAKKVINMPQMLGDVGGSMDRDSAPTGVDAGSASVQDFDDYGTYDPAPTVTGPTYGPHGGGGADRDDKGKIVCTMMNESYGFGSFRNKIWLKHSKNLVPEYQIGYHKIFLPLVRLSKTNKLLKKTLEHIAVHRTIDIRQEARGKRHLLGRIYRKILEPICYWVGKYVKK